MRKHMSRRDTHCTTRNLARSGLWSLAWGGCPANRAWWSLVDTRAPRHVYQEGLLLKRIMEGLTQLEGRTTSGEQGDDHPLIRRG